MISSPTAHLLATGISIVLPRFVSFSCSLNFKVNDKTVLAFSGDVADFQFLLTHIEKQTLLESLLGDGFQSGYAFLESKFIFLSPQALHSWITRVMYNRRSQFNPLWNTYIIGGLQDDGTPFLGYSSMLGVCEFYTLSAPVMIAIQSAS